MEIQIQLTRQPIASSQMPPANLDNIGAWTEFRGFVRGEEDDQAISALEYEAYLKMAEREMRRLLVEISERHPCLNARVIHRVGVVPVGEAAIYVGIASTHRAEGFALLAAFMDRLKQEVPIWKRQAIKAEPRTDEAFRRTRQLAPPVNGQRTASRSTSIGVSRSLDEAIADIRARCVPLPPVRVPLMKAFGRVLRETVCAPDDLPPFDRSAMDGFAIRRDDPGVEFRVVDSLRAGDWKPRTLQPGDAVHVATGAALPGDSLQVVMQEDTQREGDIVRVLRREAAMHVRFRGEDRRAGQPLVRAGVRLDAGALALLASIGHMEPVVSPCLRVLHLATGDEIVFPHQKPNPGQIRDSNSMLLRSLLRSWPCEVEQHHLPEDFETAWRLLNAIHSASTDVLLISGGASVGERDFTRALLERLGFEIVFGQIRARPGKPAIFGVNGSRIAFGLPGNPLAHFVCFHLEVATALAGLLGAGEAPQFLRGKLAAELRDEPSPRETLWPARMEWPDTMPRLRPLAWNNSGDITCLAETTALIRVPAQSGGLEAGVDVEFLPTIPVIASQTP